MSANTPTERVVNLIIHLVGDLALDLFENLIVSLLVPTYSVQVQNYTLTRCAGLFRHSLPIPSLASAHLTAKDVVSEVRYTALKRKPSIESPILKSKISEKSSDNTSSPHLTHPL